MDRRSVLASGVLLPLAGLGAARAQTADPAVTVDGRLVLQAYRSLVDEHLSGVLRALKALAATSDAASGDWERIKPALVQLGQTLPTAAAVWFMAPDGRYHTVAGGLSAETLRDREYFPGLVAGQDVRAALVVSKATGHRSIVVAAPVWRDGKVVAAIGVSDRTRLVSELVDSRSQLPADLLVYALDAQGRTVIHRDPDLMFEFPAQIGDASLKAAVTTILGQDSGQVAYVYAGQRKTALFDRSAVTGWKFVLAASRP